MHWNQQVPRKDLARTALAPLGCPELKQQAASIRGQLLECPGARSELCFTSTWTASVRALPSLCCENCFFPAPVVHSALSIRHMQALQPSITPARSEVFWHSYLSGAGSLLADCQVEQKRLGIPRAKPVAVQQWEGLIAVNYAARAAGITRHMRVAEARQKCPELICCHVQTLGEPLMPRQIQYLPSITEQPFRVR